MVSIKILDTINIGFLLSIAFYSQVSATDIIASGNDCGDDTSCSWALDSDGKLTISGSGKIKDCEWGKAPWFDYKNQIKSLEIPDTITAIGAGAFRASTQLTSVNIPNSVTSIGAGAFFDNTQLTSVTIPNSVTSIGTSAFYRTKLTDVDIPSSVTSIGEYAFNSSKLTSVTIPSSVTAIWSAAFADNQLSSVTIPDTVTQIAHGAFRSNQLTSVTIPSSVNNIWSWVFMDNPSLSEVIFEGDLSQTKFGTEIFSGTSNDLKIHFNESDANRAALEKMLKTAGENGQQKQALLMSYITDDDGNRVLDKTYEYDTEGNLLQIKDSQGNKLTYNDDGSYTKTDPNGNVSGYDSDGNLRYISALNGSSYYYDKFGILNGMSKESAFTPAEAAALVKDKGNTVSITW